MIGVLFKYRDDAVTFLKAVDTRPSSNVWQDGDQWIVNLGLERCKHLFKDAKEAERIYNAEDIYVKSALFQLTSKICEVVGEQIDVTFKKNKDAKGLNVIGVEFEKKEDAEKFLEVVDVRPGSKVWQDGSKWMVNLGLGRCRALFEHDGDAILYAGYKEAK